MIISMNAMVRGDINHGEDERFKIAGSDEHKGAETGQELRYDQGKREFSSSSRKRCSNEAGADALKRPERRHGLHPEGIHRMCGGWNPQECAAMYWITTSASRLSAYRSELGSFSETRHTPSRLSQNAVHNR
jgi:hypothetical protein